MGIRIIYLLVGVIEGLGAIGLFVPRLASPAASSLAVIMIGATITHIIHGENRWIFTLVLLALLLLIAYARRPEFIRQRLAKSA